jgi:hypothetical protein
MSVDLSDCRSDQRGCDFMCERDCGAAEGRRRKYTVAVGSVLQRHIIKPKAVHLDVETRKRSGAAGWFRSQVKESQGAYLPLVELGDFRKTLKDSM